MFSASTNYMKAQHTIANSSKFVTEIFAHFSALQADLVPYWELALANLLKPASWKDWWDSVSGNPWLFKGQLEPITKLIPDGSQVKEYIETPEWFYQAKLCYSWYPDGDGGQCSASDRLLCTMVNSMTPWYRDDTDQRGGGCRMKWGIVQQGLTPNWFNQVQICFRWHPDGDGGQCGGGAPPETCAPVGQYTAEYRDDTDRRGGGCQMSWRLVAPANAPGWLLNAKLCFNWYPDGDGGQCAAPARNLCALVNQWTAYYRDDTDRRSGGCQMSWGIQT
ncbi:unnamed protein product [Oppiella nova]|uniref:Uncharacterized protein n=1 Tax=Oppiella nova TaxID=334625 RepID=A0A7R9QRQ9_9ACAR|nr:unnamed protein product [Oppiella nova]CAG2173260.1 unnamed protein product [Oppiella nova]